MSARGKELREKIAESRAESVHGGCPEELRKEAVTYFRYRKARGSNQASISRELGITHTTMRRWCQDQGDNPASEICRVRIKEKQSEQSQEVVLVSPEGYRLEGLTVSTASQLLRALR